MAINYSSLLFTREPYKSFGCLHTQFTAPERFHRGMPAIIATATFGIIGMTTHANYFQLLKSIILVGLYNKKCSGMANPPFLIFQHREQPPDFIFTRLPAVFAYFKCFGKFYFSSLFVSIKLFNHLFYFH